MTDTLTRPSPNRSDGAGEDPRIARRRKGVEADRRHRRRVVALAVAGVVALLAGLFGLTRSPLLDVDSIVVSGADHTDHDQVVQASGIRTGDPLIGVDLAAARTAVMALPGVASARVTREWPASVRIVVTDEVPVMVLAVAEQRVVVARGGRIIGVAPDAEDPLVSALGSIVAADGLNIGMLKVGAQVPDVFAPAVVALEQMTEPLTSAVASIGVAADGSLTLTLRDDSTLGLAGGHVEMGSPDSLPAKLIAAASMVATARMACLDVLDVREPSRPTITRVSGCDAGQPTVGATTVPTTTAPKKSTTTAPATAPKSATTVPKGSTATTQKKAIAATTSTPTTSGPATGGKGHG